jgi:hypothetical protein
VVLALGGRALVPGPVLAAQSLADVARAESERRKVIARPGRLYTNRDLVPVAPPPRTPDATVDEEGGAERRGGEEDREHALRDGGASARGGEDVDDEQAWRRRVSEARAGLDRSRTIAEALQSRLNALATDFAARDDPAQRAVIATDQQKTRAEIERVRAEIERQQAAIAEIEEAARRAGIPPGWLR